MGLVARDRSNSKIATELFVTVGIVKAQLLARYCRDRDARSLEAMMASLDEQEAAARAAGLEPMPAAEIAGRLRDLPGIWDAAPASRRAIAESLFERIEVLGVRRMHITPTVAAIGRGFAEAFASSSAGYGRGERDCASHTDLSVKQIRLAPFESDEQVAG